jgi:uncharacterized metal-binding protein YceD (DUF177 family)
LGAFGVNIVGLSNSIHQFEFECGEQFFSKFGNDLVSEGGFKVDVELNKHETFIEAEFNITGVARLVCDRSLEPFEHPIKTNNKIVFKYSDRDEELSDEIVLIHRETATLELGHFFFEFIALAMPMKRLHPKFKEEENEDDDADVRFVYSTEPTEEEEKTSEEEIDPRWNILKNLNKLN